MGKKDGEREKKCCKMMLEFAIKLKFTMPLILFFLPLVRAFKILKAIEFCMSIGMSGVKSVVSHVIPNIQDDGITHVNCHACCQLCHSKYSR